MYFDEYERHIAYCKFVQNASLDMKRMIAANLTFAGIT